MVQEAGDRCLSHWWSRRREGRLLRSLSLRLVPLLRSLCRFRCLRVVRRSSSAPMADRECVSFLDILQEQRAGRFELPSVAREPSSVPVRAVPVGVQLVDQGDHQGAQGDAHRQLASAVAEAEEELYRRVPECLQFCRP